MRVLFDHGTPAPLRHDLVGHEVTTAYARGWSGLKNGELISAAEEGKFEVLVTTDKNLRYQQNPRSSRAPTAGHQAPRMLTSGVVLPQGLELRPPSQALPFGAA